MNIKELVFKDKNEMKMKMELSSSLYEGYISGRNGYNFPNKDGSYTIAYIKGDYMTKQHELYHAKYHFDKEYKKKVTFIY